SLFLFYSPVDRPLLHSFPTRRSSDLSVTRLQLDVGNMLIGGGDPMQYLQKYPDRFWSFHLKDAVADRSHDTGLGKGIFDFKKFLDRKSTRLNSSHVAISYAVFCLKKK